ncbi:MAG: hypothetical protein R2880_14625 [Deinococcales bacterium]
MPWSNPDSEEGIIYIWVTGREQTRRSFNTIRSYLEAIHQSIQNLTSCPYRPTPKPRPSPR